MSDSPTKIVHLYFYTDSVAFPRIEDQALEQTWPFLVKDRLEAEYGVRVCLCLRGLGGGTIGEIRSIFLRDIGYFRGQGLYGFSGDTQYGCRRCVAAAFHLLLAHHRADTADWAETLALCASATTPASRHSAKNLVVQADFSD